MSIIPERATPLKARTDADFDEEFAIYDDAAQTVPADLSGWSFSFVVKGSPLDADRLLDVSGAVVSGTGVTVTDNLVRVRIDKLQLAAIVPAEQLRLDGEWALHGAGPSDLDGCWAAGELQLVRGL